VKLFCYSDFRQHAYAEKYLLRSLARLNEYEVVYEKGECPSRFDGVPGGVLWNKAERILNFAVNARAQGETHFVWSDNDVVFLKPTRDRLLYLLGDHDVAFQSANGYLCTGFFIAQLNQSFIDYWTAVVNKRECYEILGGTGDQHAADLLRKTAKVTLLPDGEFWTPCLSVQRFTESAMAAYVPDLPPSVLLVHMACVAWPHKIKALDYLINL